jgi:hypothetical protein
MNLDLDALETSFDIVAPRGDEPTDDRCARMCEAPPSVKPLFGIKGTTRPIQRIETARAEPRYLPLGGCLAQLPPAPERRSKTRSASPPAAVTP